MGGRRSESFNEVFGRSTLPASARAGMPSTPVMDRVGRHVLFSSASTGSFVTALMPGRSGNRVPTSWPHTLAPRAPRAQPAGRDVHVAFRHQDAAGPAVFEPIQDLAQD